MCLEDLGFLGVLSGLQAPGALGAVLGPLGGIAAVIMNHLRLPWWFVVVVTLVGCGSGCGGGGNGGGRDGSGCGVVVCGGSTGGGSGGGELWRWWWCWWW
eukprot:2843592-Pyramimonas_sp.AAC.1